MSAVSVSEFNGVKTYNFSFGKSLPESIGSASSRKKAVEQDEILKKKIELVYDFQFHTSSQNLEVTQDGNYVITTGIYPPRLKIFDLNEMALKCERGLDDEVVAMKVLSPDYKKVVMACTDRHIELHAQYGRHFKIRVPKMPRCLEYNPHNCDLLVGCSDSEVFRLNLEEGKFASSMKTSSEGINKLLYHPNLDLLFTGGSEGVLDVFDYHTRQPTSKFQVFDGEQITAIQKDGDLTLVLGSSEGQVKLFDLRYPTPFQVKQHPYMVPINDIVFHDKAGKMIISDEKSIRIYDKSTGGLYTTVESKFKINGVKTYRDSGLLLVPQEARRIGTYFIPAMGPAPKWCSFIENLTEELEEKQTETIYSEYKFLSKEDLEKINAADLIGTKYVQGYMHGFIMKVKLYNKLKDKAQPFDYQQYKEEQVKARLEKELQKDKIFNKAVKSRQTEQIKENKKKPRTRGAESDNPTHSDDENHDNRFQIDQDDDDFRVDQETDDFKLRNSSIAAANKLKQKKK